MMEVLANAVLEIIFQCVNVPNQQLYTLNLHNAICKLDLNKAEEQKESRNPTTKLVTKLVVHLSSPPHFLAAFPLPEVPTFKFFV